MRGWVERRAGDGESLLTSKNFRSRLATAAVGLPLVIALIFQAPLQIVASVLLVVMGICTFEFAKLVTAARIYQAFAVVVAAAGFLLLASGQWREVKTFAGIFMVTLLCGAFGLGSIEERAARARGLVTAVAYPLLAWFGAWQLCQTSRSLLILVLAIAWGSDTAAYFTGKRWGRRPLVPVISPKKTVEGALGGFLGAIAAAAVWLVMAAPTVITWAEMAWLAPLGAVSAQLGDLLKSIFKRQAGVKDAGHILPGHGGMIDRTDSVMLTALTVWLIV